jgi:hypothetical protein
MSFSTTKKFTKTIFAFLGIFVPARGRYRAGKLTRVEEDWPSSRGCNFRARVCRSPVWLQILFVGLLRMTIPILRASRVNVSHGIASLKYKRYNFTKII